MMSSEPHRADMRQECRFDAFPLVMTLFWLLVLQLDGNLQVSELRAASSLRSTRLESTATTRQEPPDQAASKLLASHLRI
jgi:hypothetical protein